MLWVRASLSPLLLSFFYSTIIVGPLDATPVPTPLEDLQNWEGRPFCDWDGSWMSRLARFDKILTRHGRWTEEVWAANENRTMAKRRAHDTSSRE